MKLRTTLAASAALVLAAPAFAQEQPAPSPAAPAGEAQELPTIDVTDESAQDLTIIIPPMPTQQVVSTPAGSTDALGRQIAQVITDNLRNSGLFKPLGPTGVRAVPVSEVSAPDFGYWRGATAQALVQGFVRANGDGNLTVGCYLYDVALGSELAREGFVVSPSDWRRAAHKCADTIYTRLTGEGPYFDSRVIYVSETGPKNRRIKRLAIMDQDGANHRFLTNGQSIVLTPRFSPDERRIAYMSYQNDKPSLYVYDLAAGTQRLLVTNVSMAFAPRFSPDGRWILFTMSTAGNADIYRISANGGTPQRLTTAPGIDTGGSYSPDGSKIVFESDRSGTQQLYVMNADGTNQQRISFGGGRYATPAWSPRGDLIAFTRMGGGFRIGVMNPSGGGEKLLTDAWGDEGPSWSPNGRVLLFSRGAQGASGKSDIWSVDLTGSNARRIPTQLDGSDPSWGPLRP
ncbi:Tol-Pal system beta propeller repeat protein TolB [Sphingomonas sp. R647]|uniref:Tol-Pal system beta propeller repeat protein TolB n=1 Tax=Sphingomonas sp. R647 TaxID=2875233 RepID=UPI001CD45ED0|nr:Tol-Pal system beta propeller repeat protein TolB [Sphingomonas sp. R647]MCA1198132.1 Tol-Pal system beta propeller repeat protein TolB [Sphingomonas sp. R647]